MIMILKIEQDGLRLRNQCHKQVFRKAGVAMFFWPPLALPHAAWLVWRGPLAPVVLTAVSVVCALNWLWRQW